MGEHWHPRRKGLVISMGLMRKVEGALVEVSQRCVGLTVYCMPFGVLRISGGPDEEVGGVSRGASAVLRGSHRMLHALRGTAVL